MSWAGDVYAVIFEQGTVKVGMTTMRVHERFKEHRNMGKRFDIAVADVISFEVADNLLDYERKLKELCARETKASYGEEWFRFKCADSAKSFLLKAFEETKAHFEQIKKPSKRAAKQEAK